MEDSKELFVCSCFDVQHQFIITHDSEIDFFSFQVHLTKLPVLKRLVVAIKYLLGFQSSIGAFEEVVLSQSQVEKLRDSLTNYLEETKNVT